MKVSALNKKKGFTLIELMVVITILAAVGGISYTAILPHLGDGDRQVAQSNMASIHKVLQQFKSDNGNYPCDSTAETLQEQKPELNFGELTGDTSNAYFRQVFYGQDQANEKVFYAKLAVGGKEVKEGDTKVGNGKAFERGENAMAYVMKKDNDDPALKKAVTAGSAPLVFCSVYPSKTPYSADQLVLDNVSFRNHAFVLSCDGSVKDLQKNMTEDENDEEKATLSSSIFPETKSGRDTTADYMVLPPDL